MAHYRVRFIKDICDDTGHSHHCVEGVVDIRSARDQARAVRAAQRRFERMKRIPRWNLYADRFELDIDRDDQSQRRALTRPL